MRSLILLLAALAIGHGLAPAQPPKPFTAPEPPQNRSTAEKVGLGRDLFLSPLLSETGRVSCATCHDPNRSFIDGRADSMGQLEIGIGRNSPTMFAIGLVPSFRDPAQARFARPGREPRVMTLEERCLAPMENELEMGSSPKHAVAALRKEQGMNARFDSAFGGSPGGVTEDRLGKALAAFLRSLPPPETPYGRFLAGDEEALNDGERRGLEIFRGTAQCATCHSGPALSDGLMHVVDPPDGQRIRDRERAAMERRVELLRRDHLARSKTAEIRFDPAALAREAEREAGRLPGGGGYDPKQLEVQTTTLWDVARTAPYFRDGSIRDLKDAVRTHLSEIQQVQRDRKSVDATLRELAAAGKRAPKKLRPARDVQPASQQMSDSEMDDLILFLRALSPR